LSLTLLATTWRDGTIFPGQAGRARDPGSGQLGIRVAGQEAFGLLVIDE